MQSSYIPESLAVADYRGNQLPPLTNSATTSSLVRSAASAAKFVITRCRSTVQGLEHRMAGVHVNCSLGGFLGRDLFALRVALPWPIHTGSSPRCTSMSSFS
jgi:hypothetical protein